MMSGNAMAAGLWVANANSNTIAEYQGKLKKPHRQLKDTNDLDGPSTVAFNGGNLWVTNFNSSSIFMKIELELKLVTQRLPPLNATVEGPSRSLVSFSCRCGFLSLP